MIKKPSIAETHPDLASEALDWNPFTKNGSSKAQLKWKCPRGHHYTASIYDRINKGVGCSTCKSEKKVLIKKSPEPKKAAKKQLSLTSQIEAARKKEMLSLRAEKEVVRTIAYFERANAFNETYGWNARSVSHESSEWKHWKCPAGHVYSLPVVIRLQYRKSRCPICNDSFKRSESAGGYHWSQLLPLLVKQIDDWDPSGVNFNSRTIRKWKCERNHHFKSTIAEASKQRGRCFKCKKWKPRVITLGELADDLFVDRVELVDLVQQQINGKLHAGSKLPSSFGDEVIDVLYDDKGKAICKPSLNTYNWGYQSPIRSILERCSSCDMLIDPQREHECRNH